MALEATDGYGARLADGVDVLIAGYARDVAAWEQVARNLACALELHDLHGKASLAQQVVAHGLTLAEDRDMHTTPSEKDMRSTGEFLSVTLQTEERAALAWLDEVMVGDFSARIRRYDHRWTLSLHGGAPHTKGGSFFVGEPDESLRVLILHAYRTARYAVQAD